MATSTYSTLTKNINLYSADGNEYLQIAQDGTAPSQLNFTMKNTTDNSENNTVKPYFRTLTIKEGGVTTDLATRFAALDTTLSTNSTAITTANTAISTNATNIATNSTAISTESGARAAADTSLQTQIDAANTSVGASLTQVSADHATEVAARLAGDTSIQNLLDAEVINRGNAITTVQSNVDANSANITTLQTDMTAILNLSTEELNSFAEVAAELNNIGVATINQRLSDLEAAVAALQGS